MTKVKILEKMRGAHEALYSAKERIEDLRVDGETAEYMSNVLDLLDEADVLLFDAIEAPMWKKETTA